MAHRNIFFAVVGYGLVACLASAVTVVCAEDDGGRIARGALTIHFDNGKTTLSESDKARIRDLLDQYALGDAGKIFVLGYTDDTGDKARNYVLSRKRARTVRQAMLSAFGLSPDHVIALGKGPESPVASNSDKQGRAQNRRVEIYLSDAAPRSLQAKYQRTGPHLREIDTYIESARKEIKLQNLQSAVRALHQARAIGGDLYSDWHALYGIAGFYGGVALSKVKAHLLRALQLDAHNAEARAFIGRVEARERVASGEVTAGMGGSAGDPIAVIAMDQVYEYLQLFGVEPIAHHTLDDRPVDVWEGRGRQQEPVVYYFDYSQVYTWAYFGTDTVSAVPGAEPRRAARTAEPGVATFAEKPITSVKQNPNTQPIGHAIQAQAPQRIWTSDLFQ